MCHMIYVSCDLVDIACTNCLAQLELTQDKLHREQDRAHGLESM